MENMAWFYFYKVSRKGRDQKKVTGYKGMEGEENRGVIAKWLQNTVRSNKKV